MADTNNENRGLRVDPPTYDDWLAGIIKTSNNKNDCISRKGAMQAICDILMDAPDSEFQEGEMAGMVRAMKAVKNMSGIEPPKTKTGPTIRPASLLDVVTHTRNKCSLYPARYSEEDVSEIIHAVIEAGYVIGRTEED